LVFGAATVWVQPRWALTVLEVSVFLLAAASAVRALFQVRVSLPGFPPIVFLAVAVWGAVQLAAGWTVVKAETANAILYWLAAACLASLASQVCARHDQMDWFLKAVAIAGSTICLVGLVQVYTSEGLVFWFFPSGYDSQILGPFVSRNNYAAFVALLVPVVLTLAMRDQPGARNYLVLVAGLVAAAVASGSRAGVLLVIAEGVAVFLLCRRHGALFAVFAALATLFIAVVGYQYLWDRFVHDTDPYLVRREFLASTLAMIRAQPLHGFGLGTWTSAYPQFALIDVGKLANHAHNEWAQWAAEGGLPVFAAMLALFLWTLRAAVVSRWGIGLIAVMIHSLVDYPFMRLGLAAWIFVLLGALHADLLRRRGAPRASDHRWRIPAGAAVPLLLFSAFYTVKLAWADVLYRKGTPESLRRAVELCPGYSEYEVSLSQADPDHAVQHLERAAALNPSATNARIQLAAELEGKGDTSRAERVLLEAARNDRQFAPSWALANFYFRTGRPDDVWPWTTHALAIYRGDLRPLFDLSFLVSDRADTTLESTITGRPGTERQFLEYLVEHHRLPAAYRSALRLAPHARSDDVAALLACVDAELEAGDAVSSWQLWRQLCRSLIPCDASDGGLANGRFSTPILNRGFDWRLPELLGVAATQIQDGGPALSLSFSGNEPESCELLAHYALLRPDTRYTLSFEYRTVGLPQSTGLYWTGGPQPAYEFHAAESWSRASWSFLSSGESGRLALAYRRYPGTTRLEGTLFLRNVRLEHQNAPPFRAGISFP
jgi:O-antigen ligase